MIPTQIITLLCSAAICVMAASPRGEAAAVAGPRYPHPYPPSGPACDSKWKYIGQQLMPHFIDEQGLCTQYARQCIRIPFHDCFPDGGCDGSLILTDECTTRRESSQMIPMCGVLGRISQQYGVGAADLVNFAASLANKACPYGPYIPFYTGRTDNPTPAPQRQIPPPNFDAPKLIGMFANKGFSSTDLVALLGAHSAAYNLTGAPFDTTPSKLDSGTYYKEVLTGDTDAILFSDHSVATYSQTERDWLDFAHSQDLWDRAYVSAMTKMITQGNDFGSLTDCTEIVYELCE